MIVTSFTGNGASNEIRLNRFNYNGSVLFTPVRGDGPCTIAKQTTVVVIPNNGNHGGNKT